MYILYAIQPADAPQGPRFLRWTTDASPTLPWMGCRNTYQTVGLQLGLPYDCQIKVENWTLMGARSYIARTALCTCNLAQPGWIGLADERRKTNLQNGGECEVESCVGLSCILIYIDVLYVCVYLCIELFYGHQIYVVSLYVYIYIHMYVCNCVYIYNMYNYIEYNLKPFMSMYRTSMSYQVWPGGGHQWPRDHQHGRLAWGDGWLGLPSGDPWGLRALNRWWITSKILGKPQENHRKIPWNGGLVVV